MIFSPLIKMAFPLADKAIRNELQVVVGSYHIPNYFFVILSGAKNLRTLLTFCIGG